MLSACGKKRQFKNVTFEKYGQFLKTAHSCVQTCFVQAPAAEYTYIVPHPLVKVLLSLSLSLFFRPAGRRKGHQKAASSTTPAVALGQCKGKRHRKPAEPDTCTKRCVISPGTRTARVSRITTWDPCRRLESYNTPQHPAPLDLRSIPARAHTHTHTHTRGCKSYGLRAAYPRRAAGQHRDTGKRGAFAR